MYNRQIIHPYSCSLYIIINKRRWVMKHIGGLLVINDEEKESIMVHEFLFNIEVSQ